MDDWLEVRLGDVSQLLTGFPFQSGKYTDDDNGIRLLRGDNIGQGRLRWENVKRWPRDACAGLEDYWLAEGDVIVAMDRPWIEAGLKYAAVGTEDLPALLVQRVARLRGSRRLDVRFLRYVIGSRSFTDHITTVQTGTAVPHISRRQIQEFCFRLPSRAEQHDIASILGALDDKTDLNRRMNETLESMARLLFDSMDSSKSWRERPLSSVAEIFDGPHATPKLTRNGPIFLGISNLQSGYLELANKNHLSKADFAVWTRRVEPRAGDVVFSYETRLGQAALVPPGLQCCLGRRMGLLRPKSGQTSPDLLLRAYLAPAFQETIRQRTIHGSTVDRIPLKEMGSFPIRLPDGMQAEALAAVLAPLRAKAEANAREAVTLAATRDLLLPKLVSGDLRVSEAEKVLGDVA